MRVTKDNIKGRFMLDTELILDPYAKTKEEENVRILRATIFKHEHVIKSLRKELKKEKKKVKKLEKELWHKHTEEELLP